MILSNVRIENFKSIGLRSLDLGNSKIFIGSKNEFNMDFINAIDVLCSWINAYISNPLRGKGRHLLIDFCKDRDKTTNLDIVFTYPGKSIKYSIYRDPDEGDKANLESNELRFHLDCLADMGGLHYPVYKRYKADCNVRMSEMHSIYSDRGNSIDSITSESIATQRNLLTPYSWFYNLYSVYLQECRESGENPKETTYMKVLSLIQSILSPYIGGVRFDIGEGFSLIDKVEGLDMKRMVNAVSLVLDICRRIYAFNPGGDNTDAEGLILIEDLSIFSDRKFAKKFVMNLHKAFPRITFMILAPYQIDIAVSRKI